MEHPLVTLMENQSVEPILYCSAENKAGKSLFKTKNSIYINDFGYINYTPKDLGEMVSHFQSNISSMSKKRENNLLTILLPLSVDLYVTMLAAFNMGYSLAFFDPSRGVRSSINTLKRVKPEIIITSSKSWFVNLLLRDSLKFSTFGTIIPGIHKLTNDSIKHTQPFKYHPIDPLQKAITTFSSGSTGKLKTVTRTNEILYQQRKAILKEVNYTNDDIEYATLPLFLLGSLIEAKPVILPEITSSRPDLINQKSASKSFQLMEDLTATLINGAPKYLEVLSSFINEDLNLSIRKVFVGGAPVSLSFMRYLEDTWHAEVISAFGSTEAEPISTFSTRQIDSIKKKYGPYCIGKPISSINFSPVWKYTFYINREEIPASEVIVSGLNVATIEGKNHLSTGDLVIQDNYNNLWLVGNCSNLIIVNGLNISPYDLEYSVLNKFSLNCAIKQSSIEENPIVAFVESHKIKQNMKQDIKQIINQKLPTNHRVIIKVIRKIPRDTRHRSKILYHQLRC
ncbi:MAG: acyl--CoA ligase [Candidatus Heimdallarchaeota archaeon]|nr:acyl--CoA ligase [Candidatus Heimdallarchaeota archaeon]